jgi:hypothetical protein
LTIHESGVQKTYRRKREIIGNPILISSIKEKGAYRNTKLITLFLIVIYNVNNNNYPILNVLLTNNDTIFLYLFRDYPQTFVVVSAKLDYLIG